MAERVCPFWVGYLLASPIRKLIENPERILEPLVQPGMRILDVGCAMGFFSLPAAKLVGAEGRVVCVDLQERMLQSLDNRARKAGLHARIIPRACTSQSLAIDDLRASVDLALAIHMIHECPAPEKVITELAASLKPGGHLLVAEPKGHVSREMFADTLRWADGAGMKQLRQNPFKRSHSALLRKL